MMNTGARRGFTLIELLIVIVIIGILAGISIPKYAVTKNRALIAAMKSDLHNLVTAEEAFLADSVRYTPNLSQLTYRQTTGVNPPVIVTGGGYWSATVTHSQISNPVITCGVGVGTFNTIAPGAADGEPVCQ